VHIGTADLAVVHGWESLKERKQTAQWRAGVTKAKWIKSTVYQSVVTFSPQSFAQSFAEKK
jgi:hypothetical protein